MSALAARRAAASTTVPKVETSPAAEPQPVEANAQVSSNRTAVRTRTRTRTRSSVEEKSPASASRNDRGGQTRPNGSGTPKNTSKRQKIDNAPAPAPAPPPATRYFVPSLQVQHVQPETSKDRKGKGKARAFSPSHPVQDGPEDAYDSSGEESSSTSSGSSSKGSNNSSEERNHDVTLNDGEEGGLSTDSEGSAGLSRLPRRTGQGGSVTSSFVPREGVNYSVVHANAVRGESAGVVVGLKPGESLVLAGMFRLTPILNDMDIFSTTLSPAQSSEDDLVSHRVFAPTSHPLPVITASKAQKTRDMHRSTTQMDQSEIRKRWDLPGTFQLDGMTVFLLSELSCGLEGISGGLVPGFSNIWPRRWNQAFPPLEGVTMVTEPHAASSPAYGYITPQSWVEVLDTLDMGYRSTPESDTGDDLLDMDTVPSRPPIVIVRGPKRSGKSTFARAALNRLLERHDQVAWLECDLGQSEFSCGGVTGLWIVDEPVLGPPFTHPRIPVKAHYHGTYTPLSCPDEYIASIRQVIMHYRYELADSDRIPLVINTQGWNKGLGEELLRDIEIASEPTHIFTLDTEPHLIENGHTPASARPPGWTTSPIMSMTDLPPSTSGDTPVHRTLEAAPVSPLQARYTAADFRTLSLLSYFYSHFNATSPVPSWNFDRPLYEIPPYEITLSATDDGHGPINRVYVIGEGSDGIVSQDLTICLNGSIVALLNLDHVTHDNPSTLYQAGRPLPDFEDVTYLGLGIVRAIIKPTSTSGYTIHLLTPLPPAAIERANAIVKNGAMELPLAALINPRDGQSGSGSSAGASAGVTGKKWDDVPFVDVGDTIGVGVEKRRYRRNLMRKGM